MEDLLLHDHDWSHTLQYYSECPQLPAPMDSNLTFSWPDADPSQDKIQYLLRQKSSNISHWDK